MDTTELHKAQDLIGRQAFEIGCLKADIERLNKIDIGMLDMRLKSFEIWLSIQQLGSEEYAEALLMFKRIVKAEHYDFDEGE